MSSVKIAVSLKDKTSPKMLLEMKKSGVDIFELRIDQFASTNPAYVLKEISRFKKFPVLATIRSQKEGGKWKGSETKRLALYEAVIPKVKMIDIELSSKLILKNIAKAAKKHKKTTIISYHNFKNTPTETQLNRILRDGKAAGADIVKIAVMAKTHQDVQILLDFTKKNARKKIVVIAMGEKGMISRVLFPRFGSLVTYASGTPADSAQSKMAPGQIYYKTMLKLLGRWK